MRRGLPPRVVAEGVAGGWPWVLEASRAAQSPYRVHLTMRGRDRCSGKSVALDDQPISFGLAQDSHSDASALFGLVASEVESVVVAPLYPVRAAGQRAEIRSLDEFGRFFVVGFEAPVELARVELQPAERFDIATTMALNTALNRRRQDAEAIEVGRGNTPDGRRWRLRVWRERPQTPDLTVDLIVGDDDHAIDDRRGRIRGGGYGGPPMPAKQVMTWQMMDANPRNEQAIVGEIIPAVAHVKALLDDGAKLDAQLVRTAAVENDYFVAFVARKRHVLQLVALDECHRVLARQELDRPGADPHP